MLLGNFTEISILVNFLFSAPNYLFIGLLYLVRHCSHPTSVVLPGDPHGQRNLVGYSPWGCKTDPHDLGTKHVAHNTMSQNKTEELEEDLMR